MDDNKILIDKIKQEITNYYGKCGAEEINKLISLLINEAGNKKDDSAVPMQDDDKRMLDLMQHL
ncbi:MAG: hypothetical protein DKM50_04835 [Candidatus Margulisiibacteriota bacterium]|nr:MAG: hypothetical protein DKM50_04835 [Candidatus Margulisiibacteriota bacterium]